MQTKILKKSGFTLIEIIVVMLILGVIIKVAVSYYPKQILKGRRADGVNALLTLSLAEERYRANNTTYGTVAQVGLAASPQGYYNIASSNITATAYTLTATGQGTQANDTEGSTACSPLVLTVSAGVVTKTPAACWPS